MSRSWLSHRLTPTYTIREDRASNLSNALRAQIEAAGFAFYQPYRLVRLDRKAGQITLAHDRGASVTFPFDPLVFQPAPPACYLNEGRHFDLSEGQRAMVPQAGLAFYQRYLIAEQSATTITLITPFGREVTLPRLPGLVVSA